MLNDKIKSTKEVLMKLQREGYKNLTIENYDQNLVPQLSHQD